MDLKNLKRFFTLTVFFISTIFLTGCATLSYVGDDSDSVNIQTVKTEENFVFDVCKKSTNDINALIGITRTAVQEILVLYVQIENLSYETPFLFKVEDLKVSSPNEEVRFLPPSTYLSVWQTQEANSMSAMGQMDATITTMTGIGSNYNDFNQSIAQNSAHSTTNSAFSLMQQTGDEILKHSVKFNSQISPRKSKYFYFFFEDKEQFPISVNYKNLSYQFTL